MKNKAFSLIEISIVLAIIAVLIVGVTQGSKVIDVAKLKNAQDLTITSPVKSIDGLVLWLETSLKESFDASVDPSSTTANKVATWYDLNPNTTDKLNATQATAASQPILTNNNTINGLPTLYFDGGDLIQTASINAGSLSQGDEITIFAVQRYISGIDPFLFRWEYTGPYRISSHAPYSNGTFYFDFGLCCTSAGRVSVASPASYTNNSTITTWMHGKSSANPSGESAVWINGAIFINPAAASGTIPANYTSTFAIGISQVGFIGEMIVFNRALKPSERRDVEFYLSRKWGIKIP